LPLTQPGPRCGTAKPAQTRAEQATADSQRRARRRGAAVVGAVVVLDGLLTLPGLLAERGNAQGLEQCRQELIARGSEADPAFEAAVALCNINRD
jgi:hypothetical protein